MKRGEVFRALFDTSQKLKLADGKPGFNPTPDATRKLDEAKDGFNRAIKRDKAERAPPSTRVGILALSIRHTLRPAEAVSELSGVSPTIVSRAHGRRSGCRSPPLSRYELRRIAVNEFLAAQ